MTFARWLLFALVSMLALAGCGGGGGTSTPAGWSAVQTIAELEGSNANPWRFRIESVQGDAGATVVEWYATETPPGCIECPRAARSGWQVQQADGIWRALAGPADFLPVETWILGDGGPETLLAQQPGAVVAYRRTATGWTGPQALHDGQMSRYLPSYSPNGRHAMMPLVKQNGTNYAKEPAVVRVARGSGAVPAELLPPVPGARSVHSPAGAIADNGVALLSFAWEVDNQFTDAYYLYQPGSGWAGPSSWRPDFQVGEIMASQREPGVFHVSGKVCDGSTCSFAVTRYRVGAGFDTPEVLSQVPQASWNLTAGRVFEAPDGRRLAFWSSRPHQTDVVGWSRLYRPGQGWGPAVQSPHEHLGLNADEGAVAFPNDGRVLAASQAGISTLEGAQWHTVPQSTDLLVRSFLIDPASGVVRAFWPESTGNRGRLLTATWR